MALRFKGEGKRRALVSLEQKMIVFDKIYNKGVDPKVALAELYQSLDRDVPKNIRMLLSLWKSPISKAIRAEDPDMVQLAHKYNLVEETEEEPPAKKPIPKRK